MFSYIFGRWFDCSLWSSKRDNYCIQILKSFSMENSSSHINNSINNHQNKKRCFDNHFATKAIHEGQDPKQWNHRAVVPPISMATTFQQIAPAEHAVYFSDEITFKVLDDKSQYVPRQSGKEFLPQCLVKTAMHLLSIMAWSMISVHGVGRLYEGFEYSRSGNPTRKCLEKSIAALEGAVYGLCFASGLATTTALTHLLSSGDHVVCFDDVYGGTNRYFRVCAERMGITTTFVDARNENNVKEAIRPNTKMVWMETPTNPTMKLVDIQAVGDIVKNYSSAFFVVDNTFMSSYFQRPIELGADIVMHSLTKYMNGHSDVVMGAIATNNEDFYNRLSYLQNALGPVPSPFDCFLVNRGLKTLHVRMERHMENGLAVAQFLENHPMVEKVLHPGLPSHPQHELANRQCSGFSGMVSFYIKGGVQESKEFVKSLKIFTLAESLGCIESLVEIPSLMTHMSVPDDQREKLGITDNLIRLSVGLESKEDLLQDLDMALNSAKHSTKKQK